MNNISVIILTFNEEKHIERCISSLKSFASQVYVIDSCSTDRTKVLSESLGAKVYVNPWPGNHAKQFQWALDNCDISTEWVMKMDADEYLLPELQSEISTKLCLISEDISGVYIKRRLHFMGKWIKHGSYYPTWLLRIWRYKHGFMEQRLMDEHIKLTRGGVVYFENDLVDENLNNLTWWTLKHNNYSIREAIDTLNHIYGFDESDLVSPKFFGTQEQRKRKLKNLYSDLPVFFRPMLYFTWRYFFRFGFLDGKQGLIWHFLQGFWYRFLVDAKIVEIRHNAGCDRNAIRLYIEKEYGVKFE
ncbi:glycosyltransferase family 2 protein [Grimontia hollisae]|uniref:glycosyltransferase family 2 protein n=1 Tax=Grimontia hollisae TaxID=673 RepID=UPI0012ACCC77|nr:glycosyltransferase family 2 protein [Grimontia hollisae]